MKYLFFILGLFFTVSSQAANWLFLQLKDGKAKYYNLANEVMVTFDSENLIVENKTINKIETVGLSTVTKLFFVPWDGDNPSAIPYASSADVNKDGKVTVSDATALVEALNGGSKDNLNTDVNGDGVTDPKDLEKLISILLSEK